MSEWKLIESTQNPQFKQWKKLLTRKQREKSQTMMIEGTHLLEEAIAAKLPIHAVVITEAKQDELTLNVLDGAGTSPMYILPDRLFAELAQTQTPQGLLAEVSIPQWDSAAAVLQNTHLLLDGIQDPGNLGTMIRTAEATGVDVIWLGKGTVDATNPKVVRAAMGSSFRVPLIRSELLEVITALQAEGVQVVSTLPRASAAYYAESYPQRVAFLLGNEGRGITPELAEHVDQSVMLPMQGQTESLNVSITTAVLLYEHMRQQAVACTDKKHQL